MGRGRAARVDWRIQSAHLDADGVSVIARLRNAALALAPFAALVAACTAITHAYDFQLGAAASDASAPDAAPDPFACGACEGNADYARLPCAPEAGADPDASTAAIFFDVDAPIELGARRATWTDAAFAVGLNHDCADRAAGRAATCNPTAMPLTAFPELPHGIENAFATQLLAPLQDLAGASDVEDEVNAWIAAKSGGIIVEVDGWNGASDDGALVVRVAPKLDGAPTMVRGQPSSMSAFVSSGMLVASFGRDTATSLVLGSKSGALLTLRVFRMQLRATLASDGSMTNVLVTGDLESGGQLGDLEPELAALVFGCAPSAIANGTREVQRRDVGAFDLPNPGSGTCTRMSLGLHAAHATRLATAPASASDARTSCPVDAGAD
jgi:hypothetical protein